MKISLNLILLGGLMLAGGCTVGNNTEESYLNQFVKDGEPRRVQNIYDAQAAVGAREDGMLRAWDFDGKDLSPLGREKLSSIVAADSFDTIKVYLDVKSDTFAGRKQSVVAFLQDKGVADSHMAVIEGVNERALTPAAAGINGYAKTDTASDSPTSTSAGSGSASATASK